MRIIVGDARRELEKLPSDSVHCCVTSPPYLGMRDYQVKGQIGLEGTLRDYLANLVSVFREVRRVLGPHGTAWVVMGDRWVTTPPGNTPNAPLWAKSSLTGAVSRSERYLATLEAYATGQRSKVDYGALKLKDLVGLPWELASALRADGWLLRQMIVWSKKSTMPSSVEDRCWNTHEYIILLAKTPKYYFNQAAIREANGGPRRSVWTINPRSYGNHAATFPPRLVELCLRAGCHVGGVCLDPFAGVGTVGLVASRTQRDAILIEINEEYARAGYDRIKSDWGMFSEVDFSTNSQSDDLQSSLVAGANSLAQSITR